MTTHLHLPGWWVRAFDAAALAEVGEGGAMEQARAALLLPALAPLEMHALAMVLSSLQAQILSGGERRLTIHAQEHLKHLSTATRSRRFLFERLVQMLAGLRILRPGVEGSFTSYGPFTGDEWRRSPNGDTAVGLNLAPLGPELVLGWSDAQHDLVRFLRGEPEGVEVLGQQSPLTLSRSLWLELQGVEQLLHLRLERAVQWEARWLQLEGIFGLPLAALFHGTAEQRSTAAGGALAVQLKCLARLGRKLVAHGALTAAVADHYLALSDENAAGLTLVWQIAGERLALLEQSPHAEGSSEALRRCHHDWATPALLKLYLPAEATAAGRQAASAFADQLQAAALKPQQPLLMRRGQLLNLSGFFLEFVQRSQAGSRWPLPESLRSHPLIALAKTAADGAVAEHFARFCAHFAADQELTNALSELPFMTLASAQTRLDRSFAKAASDLLTLPSSYEIAPSQPPVDTRPRLIAPTEAPAPFSVEPRRAPAQASVFASRMLKTAADELAKMRASDLGRYDEIKRAYLLTLDEPSRRLLLDVQKRIQPAMFEEQLRQRLVRYMVENPGAWRSAEASKAGNP